MSKEIYNILKSGNAFSNPFTSNISSVTSLISTHQLDSPDSPAYASLSPENKTSAVSAIASLGTQLTSFTSHTNRVCGVDLHAQPNIVQLANVAKLAGTLEDVVACATQGSVFGTLFDKDAINSAIVSVVSVITQFVTLGNNIVSFIESVENLATNLLANIERDLNAFAASLEKALLNAIAAGIQSMADDLCLGGIFKSIMSGDLLDQVNSIAKNKADKLKVIKDLQNSSVAELNKDIGVTLPSISFGKHAR